MHKCICMTPSIHVTMVRQTGHTKSFQSIPNIKSVMQYVKTELSYNADFLDVGKYR